jgi:hypothetical protein
MMLLAGALAFAGNAEAATHYVPDNFATIQAAIDAASAGDTIMVRPGTYYENLTISKPLNLVSTDGPEVTTIDGGAKGRVIYYNGDPARGTLDGFTVTNGKAYNGGGIYLYRTDPTIQNCIITGNYANNGAGIYAYYGALPRIYDSVISDNHATYTGGGGYAYIGVFFNYRTVWSNNTAGYDGGAIASIYFCSGVNFWDSYIVDNYAGRNGGAMYAWGSSRCSADVRATNSVIAGNVAEQKGGVMHLSYYGGGFLRSSTVVDNAAADGGSVYVETNASGFSSSSNNIVYFNSSPPVLSVGSGFSYSDVEGGSPGTGNIDEDPLFVDFDGGDYHLSSGSPCIDAGIGVVAYDIEGTPRPQGAGHDMGAYEAPACAEVPTVEITSVSPDAIWPPNNKETEVVVSGYVTVPEGCTLESVIYAVDDEYGVYTGSGDLSVAGDGSFELIMTVEASRLGSDKDGRTYGVTISATDEAGDASASAAAVVLHDMR